MDIVTAGVWRYPNAAAERVGGEWRVRLHEPAELVIPRGVLHDDDDDGRPLALGHTLHEVARDLVEIGRLKPSEAAERLANHCRRYGAIDLCRDHGLPVWHDHPERTAVGLPAIKSRLRPSCPIDVSSIRVLDVSRFALFLDAMTRLATHITHQRTAAPTELIEQVLDLPLVPDHLFGQQGSQARPAHTPVPESKRVLRFALDLATTASGLKICTRWEHQRRPETALEALSTAALYIADLRSHVGTDDPDRSTTCQLCGEPVTMQRGRRPGDGTYCRKPECQKERNRLKQVRRRAREKSHGKHRQAT